VVRDWVEDNREVGVFCPCCAQYARVYRRAMTSATAVVMIAMWRHNEGREWIYLPKMRNALPGNQALGGYGTLAHWWELMEQQPGDRDDGSWRNGWWRLTDLGRAFVLGEVRVHKYVHLYNAERIGLSGERWSIRDALGNRFDYNVLMHGP